MDILTYTGTAAASHPFMLAFIHPPPQTSQHYHVHVEISSFLWHPMLPVEGTGILNDMFNQLRVDWFPSPPLGHVLELPSDLSVAEALKRLVQHKLYVSFD